MTTSEPNVKDNDRYPIGKAAKLLGIHTDTLRRHTELGLIKCTFSRTPGKRKIYKGSEILRYWRANS